MLHLHPMAGCPFFFFQHGGVTGEDQVIEKRVNGGKQNKICQIVMLGKEKRNSRPAGLDVAPVRAVHLVHLGKVAHVGQEDVDLDDLFEAGAGGLEDGGQVLDALVLFFGGGQSALAHTSASMLCWRNPEDSLPCEPGCRRQ